MDILGQLRKLIEITFKSGTHDLTIKGADGTIPGTPAPTKSIEVQIGDGPTAQSMTTDSNTQTFTNKTIDSADNSITLDTADPDLDFRVNTSDADTIVDIKSSDFDKAFIDIDTQYINTKFTLDTSNSHTDVTFNTNNPDTNFTFNSGDTGAVITLDADQPNTNISNIDNDEIKANAGIDATKIYDGSVSNTEFGSLDGVTSPIQTQINNDVQNLADHLADTVDSHDASSISYVNTTSNLTATEVQAAIDEIEGRVDTAESNIITNANNLSDHEAETTGAHASSAISYDNTTSGLIASNVKDAIDEVEGRVDTAESNISSNDTDITNLQNDKADKTITITGVGQLTGGGDLSANREIDVGPNVNLLDTNQVVTGHKTLEVTNLGTGTAINDNASSTLAEPDKTIIPLTGNPAVTNIETLTATSVAAGRIVLLRNDTVATFVIKSTGNIATTDDIELAPEAVIMLCYDGTDWDVVGGSGGGGAGGLELATLSSGPITADISTHYLVDTTASAITVNLPQGGGVGGLTPTEQKTATIRFTDSTEQFSTNNLIIVPNTGEQIDGFSIDESLIVDVAGAWVEVSWDSATSRWALNTSGGSGGGGGGGLIIEEYAFGSLPANLVKDRHYLVDFGGGSSLNASATLPSIGTDVGSIKVTPINSGGGCTVTLTRSSTDQFNDPDLGLDTEYVLDVGSATFVANVNDSTWETLDSYWSTAQDAGRNLTQRKFLSSDQTTTGVMTDLTFNNLVIGKRYRFEMQANFQINIGASNPFASVEITHDGADLSILRYQIQESENDTDETTLYTSDEFVATASTLTFNAVSITATSIIKAGTNKTFARITEINNTDETTKFT